MDEDLNEDEVEERLYAMLHYAAEPQEEHSTTQEELARALDEAPISTLRRYWRPSVPAPSAFQRVNKPPPTTPQTKSNINTTGTIHNTNMINKIKSTSNNQQKADCATPKSEPDDFDMGIFDSPISANTQVTVQIVSDVPDAVVNLESSDEDEVVEVALPPKPTITIESSDEEDVAVKVLKNDTKKIIDNPIDREISTSPVLSVVSSVSDDFIRGDCIALNISSKKPACHSFDFSLHGPDLVDTPAKKKKKKNKVTSTPIAATQITEVSPDKTTPSLDSCFATPKSKSKKNKKKSLKITEPIILPPDVNDCDSNQSSDVNKTLTFAVSEKTCPNADIYESDSSQSEVIKVPEPEKPKPVEPSKDQGPLVSTKTPEVPSTPKDNSFIDLTSEVSMADDVEIVENIVMANVTGFQEHDNYSDHEETPSKDAQLGSTKVPKILFESLDFDFLKGNANGNRKRLYSVKRVREDMEKFYNESWGGENFNHNEIQKTMSRDRSLWRIDPKDRMPVPSYRRLTCNYCGRAGHRDDACRRRPAVCHMCGRAGHAHTRCPSSCCVNCGSPSQIYSSVCSRCAHWARARCAACRRAGHVASHCPDLWRRYHNTTENTGVLEQGPGLRPCSQQVCSVCARRGHLAHACRYPAAATLYAPQVISYQPIYPPDKPDKETKKRRSLSPAEHEPSNKKRLEDPGRRQEPELPVCPPDQPAGRKRRSLSSPGHEHHNKSIEETGGRQETEQPVHPSEQPAGRKRRSLSSRNSESNRQESEITAAKPVQESSKPDDGKKEVQKERRVSNNTDKNGQVIQDNEVSDTSVAVTAARIYVTDLTKVRLQGKKGQQWLKETAEANNVEVQVDDMIIYVTGTLSGKESFQADLREWLGNNQAPPPENTLNMEISPLHQISKNREHVIRQLNQALESLNKQVGEPKALYKELNYLKSNREALMKQKIVSPKRLDNNREYIKGTVRKLNLVLLGQAGLGGGAGHLAALRRIRARLAADSRPVISHELRYEISKHYSCVFAATPREDYHHLLEIYYGKSVTKKNKKNKGTIEGKGFTAAPVPRAAPAASLEAVRPGERSLPLKSAGSMKQVEQLAKEAEALYRRLEAMKPGSAARRRNILQLSRKLHCHLGAFSSPGRGPVTSKRIKKMKATIFQTHGFLKLNV